MSPSRWGQARSDRDNLPENRVPGETKSQLPRLGEARELKQLRDENTKLKRLVADLSLDKVMLQDVVQKKF
jgi:cell division protein FtsB